MRNQAATVVTIGLLIFCVPSARGQRIEFDTRTQPEDKGGGYWAGWEPSQMRMVLRRNADAPTEPAVKVIDSSGKTTAMYPVRDFPGSSYIDIWDAKGAPNGDIIISAILAYGPRGTKPIPVKSFLLTYDSTGTLRRVWDSKPYHHHLVAADPTGNVFAFGHADNTSQSYPLLVKYSPQGEVVKKFLPSDLFAMKDAVVTSPNLANGDTEMFIRNDKLFLYIAVTQEMFAFSLDGNLLSRTPLAAAFNRIAVQNGATGIADIRTFQFTTDSQENIIVQLRVRPKDRAMQGTIGLAKFAPDGSFLGFSGQPLGSSQHQFLGLSSSSDSPIYLEHSVTGSMIIDLNKRYDLP